MQSTIESIQQAVKPHDQFQFEIKLDYELLDGRQTRYTVETYIFAPHTLGISADTYSKKSFYRDVQNYIRLKTPAMLLRDFVESTNSPLVAIYDLISQPDWISNGSTLRQLNTYFKLLAAMLNSAIREHLIHTKARIEEVGPNGKVYLVVDNLVEEFLTETETISAHFRDMFSTFNLPHVSEEILNGYQLTDESISILIEEGLIELFTIVDNYSKKSNRPDFSKRISDRVGQETKHRRQHGYLSLLNSLDENETYLYRASVLKKYAASVLFLSADISKDGQRLTHLGNAIAAGIAMIFATLVAFYFQSQFDNFTLPVFAALVVGYMFKDRIKEVSRDRFSQRLQLFLHDRRIVIRTQDGVKLGFLKEKVDFIAESQVPRLVLKSRNRDQFSRIDSDGREEKVIRHSKEIVLYANAFEQIFGDMVQITGINDILRYDIRAYLNKMAEPIQERSYLENEELRSISCHKVYHLNIVSRYKTIRPHKAKIHSRIRLVLDRVGIKRMETIPESTF
ncbi:MAG: hypothetical protein AB8G95_20000 [Anaerolineae bacterium]